MIGMRSVIGAAITGIAAITTVATSATITTITAITTVTAVTTITAVALHPGAALGADWPGWRGERGSGEALEGALPERWSATENVRWKAELPGRGVSCPVVVGGRVIVTSAGGYRERRLHVVSLDARTGAAQWRRQLFATGSTQCHPKTSMAAPTPAASASLVAVLFASWDAAAFDLEGTLLWCRSLGLDYPALSNQVGAASSPLLHGDIFICPLETDAEARIVALDSHSGETRWVASRPAGINWTTPLVLTGGEAPLLLLQSSRGLAALDLKTGAERWTHAGKLDAIASPIHGGGLIVAPGAQTVALRPPASTGGEAAPAIVWTSPKVRSSTASPLLHEGRLYAVNSAGVLACADPATGDVLWQERLEGPFSASPVAAGGRLCLINEEGVATLVDTRNEPRILQRCELGEAVLASPAIADGALFVRTERRVYRIGGGE